MGLFSIFLYTFARNCVATGARKMLIEYMFCFIVRGAFGKFLAWSFISVTDLQTL